MITRPRPVGPAKALAANHVRRLAKEVQRTFPDMSAHQHLTDAAREIDGGRMDNAKRHLDAAIAGFAPIHLIRHGIHDDEGHRAAKDFMNQAHRGRLLVMDAQSMQGENDGLAEHRRDQVAADQQQRAMRNAQPAPAGKTGSDVASPDAPEKPGSHQIAASWGTVLDAIELASTPPHETASGRKALAAKGQTAYGTSFPVPNVSYWHKALQSVGRVAAGKRGVLAAFLRKRAGQLGISYKGTWIDTGNAVATAVQAGDVQALELVGPKGYIHGWIKVAEGAAEKIGKAMGAGSVTETVSKGAGLPLESRGKPKVSDTGYIESQGSRPLARFANNMDTVNEAKQRASGLWGPNRTYADHQADVARLSPYQYKTYVAATIKGAGPVGSLKAAQQAPKGSPAGPPSILVSQGWSNVLGAIELSAETGRLASTPHPFGKPSGPGLWDVKNMELPPYIQNIARALLRTGRAKSLSQAIAIAKGATNRWSKGGGHVSPEVRAASTATNADWDAKRARAHAHSNWAQVLYSIELTGTAAGAAQDPRAANGQFGSGGSGGGKQAQKTPAQRKADLLAQAKADRAQAKLIALRLAADRAALAAASGKKVAAQKGSTTTAKAATTKSSAPAAAKTAAAASPLSAASTGLSPKTVTAATTAAKAAAGKMSKAQLTSAIKALSAQEKTLLAAAVTATQQAAKL